MFNSKKEKVKKEGSIGFGHLLTWKSSDIVSAWVNLIMLNYLTIWASDFMGLDIALVGTILLVSKIVDAFTDVIGGVMVDNTHTKLGKGRPYELAIIGSAVCSILMFCCNAEWSTGLKIAWVFFMYTMTFSIFTTLRSAAQSPYTIRHFSNNRQVITKVASYGGIITMFGSSLVSMVFPKLMATIATTAKGWIGAVALIMVPGMLIGLLRFLFCKEDPSIDANDKRKEKVNMGEIAQLFKKNKFVWLYAAILLSYNIITNLGIGTYYFKYIVGDISRLTIISIMSYLLLPLMVLFPIIIKAIGSMSKMLAMFGIVGIGGYAIAYLSGGNLSGVLAGYTIGQIGTLAIAYYGTLFVMQLATYNEMMGMPRMDGSSASLGNFAAKAGGSLGAWITAMLLKMAGYVSTTADVAVTQPDSALGMIRFIFAGLPAVLLVVIILSCFAFSKLEKMTGEYEAQKKANA